MLILLLLGVGGEGCVFYAFSPFAIFFTYKCISHLLSVALLFCFFCLFVCLFVCLFGCLFFWLFQFQIFLYDTYYLL